MAQLGYMQPKHIRALVLQCDISKEAVETAKINAAINGIETGDSFIITESDGFSGLKTEN